jgi:hypothetical protein
MRAAALLFASALLAGLLGSCDNGRASNHSVPEVPSEVTGVVVGVDSAGLGDVRSFELKDGNETFRIFIDPSVDYDFEVGHLSEHLAGGEPVSVRIDERDGKLFALTIADA